MDNEEMKINSEKKENTIKQKIGLAEIMLMVENGLTPPGIEVYDDMPSKENVESSKSQLTITKKPWLEKDSTSNVFEITPDVDIKQEINQNK